MCLFPLQYTSQYTKTHSCIQSMFVLLAWPVGIFFTLSKTPTERLILGINPSPNVQGCRVHLLCFMWINGSIGLLGIVVLTRTRSMGCYLISPYASAKNLLSHSSRIVWPSARGFLFFVLPSSESFTLNTCL